MHMFDYHWCNAAKVSDTPPNDGPRFVGVQPGYGQPGGFRGLIPGGGYGGYRGGGGVLLSLEAHLIFVYMHLSYFCNRQDILIPICGFWHDIRARRSRYILPVK